MSFPAPCRPKHREQLAQANSNEPSAAHGPSSPRRCSCSACHEKSYSQRPESSAARYCPTSALFGSNTASFHFHRRWAGHRTRSRRGAPFWPALGVLVLSFATPATFASFAPALLPAALLFLSSFINSGGSSRIERRRQLSTGHLNPSILAVPQHSRPLHV